MKNLDKKTIESFGEEWVHFDQSALKKKEAYKIFKSYFSIFPFNKLSKSLEGFDMGCGSGRWAQFVAPKVGLLHCIEPSIAIKVAKKKLKNFKNIKYYQKPLDQSGLKENSQDFGYSLGVLHHVPKTALAINSCVKLLKPGAFFLIYIYYYFDNRPPWFKFLWSVSDFLRLVISRFPKFFKFLICDIIAVFIYYPISKFIFIIKKFGFNTKNFPLYFYHSSSFYVMRTDARDRFGTPLENRFTKKQIYKMMEQSGLENIKFKNSMPFWTAIGFKKK
jgi:SAM-dependent methyltransferase